MSREEKAKFEVLVIRKNNSEKDEPYYERQVGDWAEY